MVRQRRDTTQSVAADGGEPAATGTGASVGEQPEREESTNAQVAGASDEPWPGNE